MRSLNVIERDCIFCSMYFITRFFIFVRRSMHFPLLYWRYLTSTSSRYQNISDPLTIKMKKIKTKLKINEKSVILLKEIVYFLCTLFYVLYHKFLFYILIRNTFFFPFFYWRHLTSTLSSFKVSFILTIKMKQIKAKF